MLTGLIVTVVTSALTIMPLIGYPPFTSKRLSHKIVTVRGR